MIWHEYGKMADHCPSDWHSEERAIRMKALTRDANLHVHTKFSLYLSSSSVCGLTQLGLAFWWGSLLGS